MKKKIPAIILGCLMTFNLVACGQSGTPAQTTGPVAPEKDAAAAAPVENSTAQGNQKVYQIGFTTAAVEDDPYFVFATNFSKIVSERTGGSIRIDVMGGGQLGQEGEMFSGMQMGTTDMAVMTNAYASGYVPASGLFDLPFIFRDSETASRILDGEIGQAVPMAWSETITGLQQGTIDGLDIPVSVTYTNGFPDIAKYLNMTGHFYSPLLICSSKELYDSLTPEEQKIMTEAAAEAGKISRENNKRVESVMIDEMEKQGMIIVRDVDIEAFQNVLGDFYTSRASAIGKTYVDDLMKALEN